MADVALTARKFEVIRQLSCNALYFSFMQRYFKYLSHYRFKYLSFRIFAFRMNESVTQRSFAKQNFQFGCNIIQANIFWGCQYTTELQTPYHHISCHIDIFHMVFCINKKNNITLRRYVMFYIKHALSNKPLLSTLAVIEKTICFVIFKDWRTLFFFRLHWEMKGHWSRVNLWEALLKDLHATSVLSFPNANEKKYTSILIFMLKWWKIPKKSKKSMSIFLSRDQCRSLENICHNFLMRHWRRMPLECKY